MTFLKGQSTIQLLIMGAGVVSSVFFGALALSAPSRAELDSVKTAEATDARDIAVLTSRLDTMQKSLDDVNSKLDKLIGRDLSRDLTRQ